MPEYVVKMFEAARSDPAGKRARETEIMNQAFTKTGKHMVLDLSKPFFQEEYQKYEKKFGRDESKGVPRMILANQFKNGEEGLQQAIAAGQVREFSVGNVAYCSYRTLTTGKETGTDTTAKIGQVIAFLKFKREGDFERVRVSCVYLMRLFLYTEGF